MAVELLNNHHGFKEKAIIISSPLNETRKNDR